MSLPVNIAPPLTAKEKKVMEYIEDYWNRKGIAPSYQEIRSHFNFASFNSVQRYLKQLQAKGYLHIPGGNQKRAISVLMSASAAGTSLKLNSGSNTNAVQTLKAPSMDGPSRELLTLPLLGSVAAGAPIEESAHDEFVDVPPNMVRDASRSFTLKVKGLSMIDDGIFDGDVLIIQEQKSVQNGEIAVAMVQNEATVKRFYLHSGAKMASPQVELRPSNPDMESMWFSPHEVEIKGVVLGLLRKF